MFRSGTFLLATLLAMPLMAHADNIDLLMNGLFERDQPAYIGFDSVERQDMPAQERKFLIVDFRFQDEPSEERLQASIHTICMTLLRSQSLIRSLSDDGYDMVSVAFDRRSQFDCL
ncbi:MAG: hypothetical protein LAT63_12425 [Marinobacter sp.]|nr:hypothetical protein [Marinobacter sp.]